MVQSKVKTMKYAMLVLAGLWLAACADERGFRPKQIPSITDQAQKDGKNCVCDARQGAQTSAPVQQQPSKGDQLTTPSKPNAQDSNAPVKGQIETPAATPVVQHKDEALDHTIHTIIEELNPGADSKENREKFDSNLTSADRAIQVIKGMDINYGDASGNGTMMEVKAVINDDGGDDKIVTATGRVLYGVEKLVPLQSESKNISIQAYFCLPADCGAQHPYLRVYMHVFLESGETVTAVFLQAPDKSGQFTVINSTIKSPFPSTDSVYTAKATMQSVVKSGDSSQVKGDPASMIKSAVRGLEKAGDKDQARVEQEAAPQKDQARIAQDANGKAEKAMKKTEDDSSAHRTPFFRPVGAVHDNDDSKGLQAPAQVKPLTSADAQKAMDDALKAQKTTVPSSTLPADVMMQSAQVNLGPVKSQDDAKLALDTALANTMKQINPPLTQEANKDAPAAAPAKQQEAAPAAHPEQKQKETAEAYTPISA
jgi:hypothetical protein